MNPELKRIEYEDALNLVSKFYNELEEVKEQSNTCRIDFNVRKDYLENSKAYLKYLREA